MQIQTLRLGSRSDLVQCWQLFLRGQNLFHGEAHGYFDAETVAATKSYQKDAGLVSDGVAGNSTLGHAMVKDGFLVVEDDIYEEVSAPGEAKLSPSWPPVPPGLTPASRDLRGKLFGVFPFTPAPTPGNPEGIRILGSWTQDNIVMVEVPQLVGVSEGPRDGKVPFHREAADQLVALFAAWERAGLLHHILTWAGSWVPRFVRGSRTSLSNHAWGTAFDINAQWNGLGARPALVGEKGSVRELVPLANQHGFWWLGHGQGVAGSRMDGMHFECAKLLTPEELSALA